MHHVSTIGHALRYRAERRAYGLLSAPQNVFTAGSSAHSNKVNLLESASRMGTRAIWGGVDEDSPRELGDPLEDANMLLEILVRRKDQDLQWIIKELLLRRPSLGRVLEKSCVDAGKLAKSSTSLGLDSTSSLSMSRNSFKGAMRRTKTAMMYNRPVVQFVRSSYFCSPQAKHAEVDVIRLGDVKTRIETRYRTSDITAGAGDTYEATEGTLVFEPGDSMKTIRVPLMTKKYWRAPFDFQIDLSKEGSVGTTVGERDQARVTILDDCFFPTQRAEDEVRSSSNSSRAIHHIVFQYVRMQLSNPKIRCASIKTVLGDSLFTLNYALKALMQMYLADVVLNKTFPEEDFPGDRHSNLIVLAFLPILPQFILHLVAFNRPFGVGSESRALLQKGLFATFVHYDVQAHADLHQGDLIMVMARDTLFVVDHVYKAILEMVQKVGELLIIFILQIGAPLILHHYHSNRVIGLIPMIIFPIVQILFLRFRAEEVYETFNQRERQLDMFIDYVTDINHNFHVLLESTSKPEFLHRFERKIKDYNTARKLAKQKTINNNEFFDWATVILVSVYVYLAGQLVIRGDLSLGICLVNIRVFKDMGSIYSDIYQILVRIQSAIPALQRVTSMMNAPTHLAEQMLLSRSQHALAEQKMAQLLKESESAHNEPLVDQLHIEVGGFSYQGQHFNGLLDVMQGQRIHLVGRHGQGKDILLKMIGGLLHPGITDSAKVFIAPHLHVAYISSRPALFHTSLLDNLLIGFSEEEAGPHARAMRICKRLGLSEAIIRHIESESVKGWQEVLSYGEALLLCFARVLIESPEIICIERHSMGFCKDSADHLHQILAEHTENRGLEKDPSRKDFRRPRTCIILEDSPQFVTHLDGEQIFHISIEQGIRWMDREEVTLEMLE